MTMTSIKSPLPSSGNEAERLLERAAIAPVARATLSELLIQRDLMRELDRMWRVPLKLSARVLWHGIVSLIHRKLDNRDAPPIDNNAYAFRTDRQELADIAKLTPKTVGEQLPMLKLHGLIASLEVNSGHGAKMYIAFGNTSNIEADIGLFVRGE